MHITCRWYGTLKAIVGSRESCLELPEGTTLGGLARALREACGEEVYHLLGGDEPFGYLRVLVNGRDHFTLRALDTVLSPGDIVTFMPPMVGG